MIARLRRVALTAHVACSVGWLGAVAAYLALAIAGLRSQDPQLAQASYLALEFVGWFVVVPFAFAALVTGLVQALGTEWGLFRYYWIAAKLVLTVIAVAILVVHMRSAVSPFAALVRRQSFSSDELWPQRVQLVVHPAGGLLLLLATTALSVFKPWGLTPYGRRTLERRKAAPIPAPAPTLVPIGAAGVSEWWIKVIGAHAVIALVLIFALHLLGVVPHH